MTTARQNPAPSVSKSSFEIKFILLSTFKCLGKQIMFTRNASQMVLQFCHFNIIRSISFYTCYTVANCYAQVTTTAVLFKARFTSHRWKAFLSSRLASSTTCHVTSGCGRNPGYSTSIRCDKRRCSTASRLVQTQTNKNCTSHFISNSKAPN